MEPRGLPRPLRDSCLNDGGLQADELFVDDPDASDGICEVACTCDPHATCEVAGTWDNSDVVFEAVRVVS